MIGGERGGGVGRGKGEGGRGKGEGEGGRGKGEGGRGKGERGEGVEGGRDIMIFQDNSLPMNCQLRGAGSHKNITEPRACGAYKPHDLNRWYN